MEISTSQKIIQRIREKIPLSFRQKVGPLAAYFVYVWSVYVRKNRQVPKVLSLEETINAIIKEELSVIRFGDGEMSLMENEDLGFQDKDCELAVKLKKVLQTDIKGLLICIPGFWGKLDMFVGISFRFILHHLFRFGHIWRSLLSYEQIYGDAYITRPYLGYKDKTNSGNIFKKLFSIWEDKKVVLIEGEKSRLGVGNDMFDKVSSLERILCPAEGAFLKYEEIKNKAVAIDKDKLILVSIGPAAKVLAYDLFLLGYRVIDVGHIDMEYEMFLKKETKLVKVQYKYFNEIDERNPDECTDPKYLSQIIGRIK